MFLELSVLADYLDYFERTNMLWTPVPYWVNPNQITRIHKLETAKLISGFDADVYCLSLQPRDVICTIIHPDEINKRIRKRT